jgi:hypothetical protein
MDKFGCTLFYNSIIEIRICSVVGDTLRESMNLLDKCSISISKKKINKISWLISSNVKVEFSLMMRFWIRSLGLSHISYKEFGSFNE